MRGTLCGVLHDDTHRCNLQAGHDPDANKHRSTAGCNMCLGLTYVTDFVCVVCRQNDGKCLKHLRIHEEQCFRQFVRGLPEQYIERTA